MCEVRKFSNLINLIKEIQNVRQSWGALTLRDDAEVWFRGVASNTHELKPGAYRLSNFDEEDLLERFKLRAVAYLEYELRSNWDWYFLMQHFGLPTRLLDWTENPLAALFFAVWKWDEKTTPIVWMMEAGTLNKIATGVDEMIIPGGLFSENWLPNKCHGEKTQLFDFKDEQYENAKPLAILPKHINRRITAQHSVFTVHGIEQHCISSVFGEAEGNEGLLLQFEMNGCQRKQLLEELATLGISESSLFPELSMLANDLKRELGLEVK